MGTEKSYGVARSREDKPTLQVGISNDLERPSGSYQLLLAFHFGKGSAPVEHPCIVSPGLVPTSTEDVYECWWYAGDVRYETDGPIRIADCADYSVAIYSRADCGNGDIEAWTLEAYLNLLDALSRRKHSRPVRIWNYIGGINDGVDDKERYRRFSVGRAQAFHKLNISDDLSPSGTAIGTNEGSGLCVIAIATDQDFRLIENPRQVSAFKYPRQYGPSSPKFGRGCYVSTADHRLYFISGTASVVGHESLHPYDSGRQLAEILRNLAALCDSVSGQDSESRPLTLDRDSILRVYLRNPEDSDAIEIGLRSGLRLGDRAVLFLQGDICRRELMVEIEGVKVCHA